MNTKTYTLSIQSFVDLITNSSTSIYTFYSEEGLNQIKQSLNNIIRVFAPDANIDDILEIKIVYTDGFLDYLKENPEELFDEDDTNEESLLNYSKNLEVALENYQCDWYEHYDTGVDIEIHPKDPKYEWLIHSMFTLINTPFNQDALYT